MIVFLSEVSINSGGVSGNSREAVFKMPELLKIVPVRCGSHGPVIMVNGELESSSGDHSVVSKVVEVLLTSVTVWLSKY